MKYEVQNQLDAIMLFLMVLLSNADSFPFSEGVAKDVIILVKVYNASIDLNQHVHYKECTSFLYQEETS